MRARGVDSVRTPDNFRQLISVFVCIVLAMLGMIIGLGVLGDFSVDAIVSLLGAGVAASLIASGVSGLFALWIIGPQTARSVEEAIRSTLGHPVHILSERRYLAHDFSVLTESAKTVDIISLSLANFVENTPPNSLLRWIAEGKCLRLLVLAPSSPMALQRGREEGINLPGKIKESLRQLQRICEQAKTEVKKHHTFNGSLEVRVFDSIPYFAYFRCDGSSLLGLYYSHVPGIQSEVIRLDKGSGSAFIKAEGHFEKLWNECGEGSISPESRRVCIIKGEVVEFSQEYVE